MTQLTSTVLRCLRTRRVMAASTSPQTAPDLTARAANLLAARAAQTAEIARISEICGACRVSLHDPATSLDDTTLAIIEDCAFAALPACTRRRLIRQGKASCPLGLFGTSSDG